ncbi:MAG: hypothetical protein WA791_15100, partial [Rhodomicrobium sp.]
VSLGERTSSAGQADTQELIPRLIREWLARIAIIAAVAIFLSVANLLGLIFRCCFDLDLIAADHAFYCELCHF